VTDIFHITHVRNLEQIAMLSKLALKPSSGC
jgi:hypothetical protein